MKHPWTVWRPVDDELCRRIGVERFRLAHTRRQLWNHWAQMTYADKRTLVEGGTAPRFSLLAHLTRTTWGVMGEWERLLDYMEHTDQDIREMERGEYPISPWVIRIFSALYGIKVEFLLLGSAPEADKVGANIEVWPLAGAR